MSLYYKVILAIFGLAYFISPVDVIPDLLLPYIGWIDDGIVFATIFYMIRYGRLPSFLFNKKNPFAPPRAKTNRFSATRGPSSSNTANHRKSSAAYNSKEKTAPGPNPGKTTKKTGTPPQQKTPYDILGIKKNATKKELQTAYKEAIKKYHPDKLSHLGEEFSTLANEKFLEIQTAYESLLKKY